MNQEMIWRDITEKEYREQEKALRRLPLLQSTDYTEALSTYYGHQTRSILIESSKPFGVCKINYREALKGMLQAVMCDCGPVWFEGQGTENNFQCFAALFKKQYPRRLGRKRRYIPEWEHAEHTLLNNGFKKTGEGYQTLWLDLTQNKEMLRSNIKKNWRGSLQKAEKSDLTIEWDETGKTLPFILKTYDIDKKRRNYPGPSVPLMRVLADQFAKSGNLLIGRALLDNECVGSILLLCHGASATYQIGWTGEKGRTHNAHHLLLWNALNVLKHRGIKDFDLGGINDDSASGVAKFKNAMGGDSIHLPGIYT
ncbi:GNAT family N-acetyltransferase [Alphaproteobacteria bacterium]|nr:GNAT family N-acetyltransferase [Alphaproteobacteria bacterium]